MENENNELEKMNNLVKEFNEKFGNVDPSTLTGETKKMYTKLKNAVDGVKNQSDMMNSALDFMSQFGVNGIKMGSKSFSKVEEPSTGQTQPEPEPEQHKYTPSQFDDIMNVDDEKLMK